MRKRIVMLALVSVATLGVYWIAEAGDLEPPAPPAPTGRTTIFQGDMPFAITTPGSYVVKENLTGILGQNGITISADDVTLDLNGFTLTGVPGSIDGVNVPGSNNTRIINGTVRDWGEQGIDAIFATGSHVEGITVSNNTSWGIRIGTGGIVRNCIANDNGSGIEVSGGSMALDSVARSNNDRGFATVDDGYVVDCIAVSNTTVGFQAEASGTGRFERCHAANNGVGFQTASGGPTAIMRCTAHGNTTDFNGTFHDADNSSSGY